MWPVLASIGFETSFPPPKDKIIIRSHNESFFLWPMAYIGLAFALVSLLDGGVWRWFLPIPPWKRSLSKEPSIRLWYCPPGQQTIWNLQNCISPTANLWGHFTSSFFSFSSTLPSTNSRVFLVVLLQPPPPRGIILWQFGWLDNITNYVAGLDIRLSAGFYFFSRFCSY